MQMNIQDFNLSDLKEKFSKNKSFRLGTIIVGSLIGLVLLYFAYRQFVWKPVNDKANNSYWKGQLQFNKDSVDAAIKLFKESEKKYGGSYTGGEISKYHLARCLMDKKDFKGAAKHLEEVQFENKNVEASAKGLLADCYSEMGKYEKAMQTYEEASSATDHELISPQLLQLAGRCAIKLNKTDQACDYFSTIKHKYPVYSEIKSIDKFIGLTCGPSGAKAPKKSYSYKWLFWLTGGVLIAGISIYFYSKSRKSA